MIARQKVGVACSNCRTRKRKCDGTYPVCLPCKKRQDSSCSFRGVANGVQRRDAPLDNEVARRQRHRSLTSNALPAERSLNQPKPSNTDVSGLLTDEPVGNPRLLTLEDVSDLHESIGTGLTPRPASHVATVCDPHDRSYARDSDAMTGIIGGSAKSTEFFGSSSASSFMKQISTAIDARLGRTTISNKTLDPAKDLGVQKSRSIQDGIGKTVAYKLPTRKLADSLLTAYYDLVWAVFPIHDRTVFDEAYQALWTGADSSFPEDLLHCMLNLAFALGCQFSGTVVPNQRRDVGEIFWTRALEIFGSLLGSQASLIRVQCLLLIGMYSQTIRDSYQCWMTIGAATRMAQSLGLHRATIINQQQTPREVEISRRTWHGCVFMDRVLSMTFGRPSMVSKWLCDPVPPMSMTDDEYLDIQNTPAAVRPDGSPTIVAFFVKAIELYGILDEVVSELYGNGDFLEQTKHHDLTAILRFDDRLMQFVQSLPAHLRYLPAQLNEHLVLKRQQIVLRCRFLHVRITVFRPVLAEIHQQRSAGQGSADDKSLSHRLVRQCSLLCCDAAYELIEIIYTHVDLETVTGPVPAWWFTILFIYTAATVLLAEKLQSPVQGDSAMNSTEGWLATWGHAMDILRAYSRVSESAQRCLAALEILSAKASGHELLNDGPPEAQQPEPHRATKNSANVVIDTPDVDVSLIDDVSIPFDFTNFDFDIDDVEWLHSSAGDIMFP